MRLAQHLGLYCQLDLFPLGNELYALDESSSDVLSEHAPPFVELVEGCALDRRSWAQFVFGGVILAALMFTQQLH